jgi:hypothetical protein
MRVHALIWSSSHTTDECSSLTAANVKEWLRYNSLDWADVSC